MLNGEGPPPPPPPTHTHTHTRTRTHTHTRHTHSRSTSCTHMHAHTRDARARAHTHQLIPLPVRSFEPWLPKVPDFIDRAFRAARNASATAKLFYNDYGAEAVNAKSDRVLALVKEMRQRGVPIDGVGFQMYHADNLPAAHGVRIAFGALRDVLRLSSVQGSSTAILLRKCKAPHEFRVCLLVFVCLQACRQQLLEPATIRGREF